MNLSSKSVVQEIRMLRSVGAGGSYHRDYLHVKLRRRLYAPDKLTVVIVGQPQGIKPSRPAPEVKS